MITLQFVRAPGLSSTAIALYERGWPSHVDAVLSTGELLGARSDSIGGKPPGVQVRPPKYEAWTRVERISLPASPEVEADFWQYLNSKIGAPYDEAAIFGFAFGQGWTSPNAYICSGLQTAALTAAKWFAHPPLQPHDMVTPWELLLMVWPWAEVEQPRQK